jgi:hypothetical protein
MRKKPYYSVRTGENKLSQSFDLASMRNLFKTLFIDFEGKGYFQEAFGYECIDSGFVPGTLGQNLAGALMLALRKDELTPIGRRIENYAEDDLFDVVEFLYEHCSRPIKDTGFHHSFNGCGWHFRDFERESGRQEYRERINELLAMYKSGYELSEDGEILTLADDGLGDLFDAELPELDFSFGIPMAALVRVIVGAHVAERTVNLLHPARSMLVSTMLYGVILLADAP